MSYLFTKLCDPCFWFLTCCFFFYMLFLSHSVASDSLCSHRLQHTKLPCPSPSPGVCSDSSPLSRRCHPTISSSVVSFSSCLQSFPTSGSFPINQHFTSGGQNFGASASVLPINIQDWFPLGLTGLVSFLSKGPSGVFSSTTVWMHTFFGALPSAFPTSQRKNCFQTVKMIRLYPPE